MRLSRPQLTNEEVEVLTDFGKPVTVPGKGTTGVQVFNLKSRNPAAWENHICEVRIGERFARVNVADLIKALRFA